VPPGRGSDRPERLAEDDVSALGDAAKKHPIIIGLNKVDRVAKPELLPLIEQWNPALSRWVPAQHRFTLLRVERAGG